VNLCYKERHVKKEQNMSSIVPQSIANIFERNLSYVREDVLLKEGLSVLSSISSKDGFKELIRKLCLSMPRIVGIVVLKQLISNPEILLSLLKSWAWIIIKTLMYDQQIVNETDTSYITNEIQNMKSGEIVNFAPIYIDRTDVYRKGQMVQTISYMKGIHYFFMKNLNRMATKKHNEYLEKEAAINETKCSIYKQYSNGYFKQNPANLYPSKNLTSLEEVIRSEIEVSILLDSYSVFGILIDGEPGLGKSSLADYIATTKVVKGVMRVDMSIPRFFKTIDSTKIFDEIFHEIGIDCSCMFVIDEMDKYLNYMIDQTYNTLVQDEKNKKNNKSGNNSTSMDIISYEDHSRQKRTEFLHAVLSILERPGINHPCIVVFCSNNFDTIFGDLDMTHFQSINDRFTRFRFERMDTQEVISYLKYNNKKFENTRFYCRDLDILIMTLRKDIDIPARKLHQIVKLASYDFKKIIHEINVRPNYPIKSNKNKNLGALRLCDMN